MSDSPRLIDFLNSPILSSYREYSDNFIFKSHIELREYKRNGKTFLRKTWIADNTAILNTPITSFAQKDFSKIKQAKQEVINQNYSKESVNELIDLIANEKFINKLSKILDHDSILLPMPSSSGKNVLPKRLSERISKELGTEVILDPVVTSTHLHEAKKTRGVDKLINQQSYKIVDNYKKVLEKYKDKNIYIVDDIFTTGQSTNNLAKMLEKEGYYVPNVISFAKADGSFTSLKTIEKIANLASDKLGINIETAKKKLEPLLKESSTIGFQMYQDLNSGGKTRLEKYKNWFAA